jgi:prepilin-type processing-associated H-X9-DG protein
LFPVFATAREKARQTSCLSNEKQLGIAIAQYIQDYDERIPSGTWIWGGGCGWAGQVYPYVKSTGAFMCPNDVQAANPTVSYAINANLSSGGNGNPNMDVGIQVSQMISPARTVMLCEIANNTLPSGTTDTNPSTHTYNLATTGDYLSWSIPSSPGALGTGLCTDPTGDNEPNCNNGWGDSLTMKYATGYFRSMPTSGKNATFDTANFQGPTGRHNGGSNYLFCDCHCKWSLGNNVAAGIANNSSWAVCGGLSGSNTWYMAHTDCGDATLIGTFNIY